MRVYVGQTRTLRLIEELAAHGFGECVSRGDSLPPRRRPWFLDNGAFKDHKAGRPFDELAFGKMLDRGIPHGPDFVILPDIVGGGEASLELSLSWRVRLGGMAPLYLVVQEGMAAPAVEDALQGLDGLFLGGASADWKRASAATWATLAHGLGLPFHYGRAGNRTGVLSAIHSGADSLDSCLPLWSKENLATFVRALRDGGVL